MKDNKGKNKAQVKVEREDEEEGEHFCGYRPFLRRGEAVRL